MGEALYLTRVKQQSVSIPYIVLRGRWLEKAGFHIGASVAVSPDIGKLVITPSCDSGLEDLVRAPEQVSSFTDTYQGYTVNLKLERSAGYKPIKLAHAMDVYRFLKPLQDEAREVFLSLMMDNLHNVVGVYEVGKGGTESAPASCFEVIKAALMANSRNIVLAHNHPGGDTEPSSHDITLTEKYQKMLNMMEMNLLDHVIIGYEKYASMLDLGYIK